jgi:hypothetical protein
MDTTSDEARLLLTFPQQYQVWIQLPRLYPHVAPAVSRIVHPTIGRVHVARAEHSHMLPHQTPADALVFWWSPIQQLGDLLHFLVHALPKHAEEQQQQERNGMTGEENIGRNQHNRGSPVDFQPNRFDQGYERPMNNDACSSGGMEIDDL